MAPNTEFVHVTKKSFKCPLCASTFTQTGSLNRHFAKIHEGKKQFPCEKCDSEFIRKHDLKLHTKTVHEETKPIHVGNRPSKPVPKYSDNNFNTTDKLIQVSPPLTTQKRKRKNNSKYEDSKICDSDLPAAKRSKYDGTSVQEEKDNVFVSVASNKQLKYTFKKVKKAGFSEICTNLAETFDVLEKQVLEQLKKPIVENEGETPIQKKKKNVNKHVETNELVIENSEFDASGEQLKFTIKMVKHVKKASFLGHLNLKRKDTEHQIKAKKTRKSGRLSISKEFNSSYEQFYNQKYNKESSPSENKKKFQCPLCGDKFLRAHFLEAHIKIIHEKKDLTSESPTRSVVPVGAMAPPNFGRSVNPISARGARLCPPNNTATSRFSDLPKALSTIDTEANEKEDSIVNSDEKNEQSLVHAKTLNSGKNDEKSFQNTNEQEESDCLIKKEHCHDQPEYETYDFIQYETSEGVPFLETYELVTVEQLKQIIKNAFKIELTSNILKSIEDSVIDSVMEKLSNCPATVD